jgi:hypothetical protein
LPTGSAAAPLLICSNLLAAALVLLIVLVHHRSQIWLIYLVIFLYSVIGSAIGPAQTALLPALVPEELLAQANGVQQTLNQGCDWWRRCWAPGCSRWPAGPWRPRLTR